MARMARRNPATHRLRSRRPKPPADQGRPGAEARRNPRTRKILLSRIASALRLDRFHSRRIIHQIARDPSQPHPCSRAPRGLRAAVVRPNAVRIALGAGAAYGSAKCWPPSRFAELANHLQAQWDADVILFGAAGETDVSSAIASEMKRAPIDLTGKTTVADLPALLSHCHVFIGNDAGAMHVAAAVGLPAVAIFGPTDPFGTAPVTPRHTIVREQPYCSPCFVRRCPIDHRCMTRITTSEVQAAVDPWLASVVVERA